MNKSNVSVLKNKMKTVQELCRPKENIFKEKYRTYTLNLIDLAANKIDPGQFFDENYITGGMDQLLRTAFERFEGKSDTAVVKLTQAMGGGKTHNQIVLGLMARHPEYRKIAESVIGKKVTKNSIRVIAISGRESDMPHGLWGEVARQIGRLDFFKDYYSPLRSPGETAWVNLLKNDEPTLILIDELPPYLHNAKSVSVGNSDLSEVTTTAISNLFNALTKEELSNVLLVFSDLEASYQGATSKVNQNLVKESKRIALQLTPVRQNTDEVYNILRKKLFDEIASDSEIEVIADAYAEEIKKAKELELTHVSEVDFKSAIKATYPFHPSIRDLYARFKENDGFQQTRGLIRLMRILVSSQFDPANKEESYLLGVQHFDFNSQDTINMVNEINKTLENAISHDIASSGNSVSEQLDQSRQDHMSIHQEISKLLYFSSLSSVPNAIRGLSESDIVSSVVYPGFSITDIKQTILPVLRSNCWYLHLDKEGKYLFRETQNIVARINSLVQSYDQGTTYKEIRDQLNALFKPVVSDVYQKIAILPILEEIKIDSDNVTLMICSPEGNPGIPQDIQTYFDNQIYKNRILFLTGERSGMDSINIAARNIKAVSYIISELKQDKVSESELQFKEAVSLLDTYRQNFLSATRETFTRLIYPHVKSNEQCLISVDISMNFNANDYDGEKQIRLTLQQKQKFTDDVDSETFKLKIEDRLFGESDEMDWSEIKKRAAMNTKWQWHAINALEKVKALQLKNKNWNENGKYISKKPKPLKSDLVVSEVYRDEDTGLVQIRFSLLNGDKVYYDFHSDPTEASMHVKDLSKFETQELNVRFLCVDSTGKNEKGSIYRWQNNLKVKYGFKNQNGTTIVQLKSIPEAPIRYTTDGSNPFEYGGIYEGEFTVTRKSRVLACAESEGVKSDILSFDVDPGEQISFAIDPKKEIRYLKKIEINKTNEVYRALDIIKKNNALIHGVRININPEPPDKTVYAELIYGEGVVFTSDEIRNIIETSREKIHTQGSNVQIKIYSLYFETGDSFKFFANDLSIDYEAGDLRQ